MFALACAFLACTQPLPTTPDDALFLVQGEGGISVAYFCGNTFQFRNRSMDTVTVQWRVHGVQESGELFLPARGGAEYSETYLTTQERGPLQVSQGGQVLATIPNKHTAQCEIPVADTTRPAIPAGRFDGADSAFVVASPTPGFSYFRRYAGVLFRDTVSGLGIRRYLQQNGLEVTGGFTMNGAYIVKFADPGTTFAAFNSKLASLAADARVRLVIPIEHSTPPPSLQYIRPTDGAGFTKADWTNPHPTSTWALQAVHAPDSWGCTTGTVLQPGQRPRIGVVEWGFGGDLTDLAGSVRRTFVANGGFGPLIDPDALTEALWHGKTVAEVATGTGNNGFGIPGVTWSSDLYLYGLGLTQSVRQQVGTTLFVQELLPEIEADGIRALNFSIDFQADPNYPAVAPFLQTAIEGLLQRNPGLTLVKSTGNDGADLTPSQVAALNHGGVLLIQALSAIKSASTSMGKQIIFVAGSWDKHGNGSGGEFWTRASGTTSSSTFVRGQTDLIAPAALLTLPGNAAGSRFGAPFVVESGTSFAAPMVLGAIAELLSNDPNLTPGQVLSALVDGAAGLDGPPELRPAPVNGAPEPVYQLNVYRSLRLTARSAGTPLCGNRIWAEGGQLWAERGATTENLFDLAAGQSSWIWPFHGGRSVGVADNVLGIFHRYDLTTFGTWVSNGTARGVYDTSGGAGVSALGVTHDRDTTVSVSSNQVRIQPRNGSPTYLRLPEPTSTTPTGSGCLKMVRSSASEPYHCEPGWEVGTGTWQQAQWMPEAAPAGTAGILLAQNVTMVSASMVPGTYSCYHPDQPPQDGENCYRQDVTSTMVSGNSLVYRIPWSGGTPVLVDKLTSRSVLSLTASEDATGLAVFSAVFSGLAAPADCGTQFYELTGASPARMAGAFHPYGAGCDSYGEQGSFGPTRESQANGSEPVTGGFALQARLARTIGQ